MNTIQRSRCGLLALALGMGLGWCTTAAGQQAGRASASSAADRVSQSGFLRNSMLPRGDAPTMRAAVETTRMTIKPPTSSSERATDKVRPVSYSAPDAAACVCERSGGGSACGPACTADCPPAKRGLSLFCVFDSIAGGIEHVLGLENPACRTKHSDGLVCDQAGCDTLPPIPYHDVTSEPMIIEPRWPSAPEIIERGPLTMPRVRELPEEPDSTGLRDVPLTEPPSVPSGNAKPQPLMPAPQVPDSLSDPFEDDQAWMPGRDPSIQPSAYFE